MLTPADCMRFYGGWESLMIECKARKSVIQPVFEILVAAYCEPHRHYHNLQHIVDMLDTMPWLQLRDDPDKVFVELATWFHDVAYSTRDSDNEERSCNFAQIALNHLGFEEAPIRRVCELIMMTKHHEAPEEDENALLMLDGDLSILGMDPEIYNKCATAIRQEYRWVPDRDFLEGRRKVLRRFLDRPRIYRSKYFRASPALEHELTWEARARANLTAEIADIDAKLQAFSFPAPPPA